MVFDLHLGDYKIVLGCQARIQAQAYFNVSFNTSYSPQPQTIIKARIGGWQGIDIPDT